MFGVCAVQEQSTHTCVAPYLLAGLDPFLKCPLLQIEAVLNTQPASLVILYKHYQLTMAS